MAMACLREWTVPPLPPLPDFSVPRFSRCMARSTLFAAAGPYLRLRDFLFAEDFFAGTFALLCLRGGTQRIGCKESLQVAKIFAAEIILVAAKQSQNTFLSD